MPITRLEQRHEHAIRRFEKDFDDAGEVRIPAWFADRSWSHATRVERVNGWERGEYLGEGWVPCTTRFVEEDGALLGVVNVRHELTEQLRQVGGHVGYSVRPSARRRRVGVRLLEAGLAVLAELGIEQALLTCDDSNLGSIRIIEHHGGQLSDAIDSAEGGRTLRFWVPVPGQG